MKEMCGVFMIMKDVVELVWVVSAPLLEHQNLVMVVSNYIKKDV